MKPTMSYTAHNPLADKFVWVVVYKVLPILFINEVRVRDSAGKEHKETQWLFMTTFDRQKLYDKSLDKAIDFSESIRV